MKNKRKTKNQAKGITLIALVVTIVILLILAGVSINLVLGPNGLITKAQEATLKTEKSTEDEEETINNASDYIDKILGGETATTVAKAKGGKKYNNTTPITDDSGDTLYVPGGFKIAEDSATDIDDGVVITDGKNEFVWVPVQNVIVTDINEANSNKAMALLNNSTQNYSGIFYDVNVEGNNIIGSTIRTTNYAEPRLATWSDTDERMKSYGYNSAQDFLETMQKEYNDMVKSVDKYKGFYIGRYETSMNEKGEVQSKKDVLPYSGPYNWYNLYENQKLFNSDSVQSSMIWGSQYDAMLNWIISGNRKNDLLEISRNETEKVACANNKSDIINNIYDLTGNVFEWTLAQGAELNARGHRGSYFGQEGNALRRSYTLSGYSGDMNGSRMTLYIK